MILLDTHAWLWLRSSPEKLSSQGRSFTLGEPLAVSAISCWEVATLSRLGRIKLDSSVDAWIGRALSGQPEISVVPVSRDIATNAGGLDEPFPGDPADRIIFTTAVVLKCSLLTKDRRLRDYSPAVAVWD